MSFSRFIVAAALESTYLDQRMLEQTAIDEAALLDYPLARRPASCRRWGVRTQALLSRQGCAYVLTLHAQDLGEMTRSDRAAAEKVYGALLSDRGGFRKQRTPSQDKGTATTSAAGSESS